MKKINKDFYLRVCTSDYQYNIKGQLNTNDIEETSKFLFDLASKMLDILNRVDCPQCLFDIQSCMYDLLRFRCDLSSFVQSVKLLDND